MKTRVLLTVLALATVASLWGCASGTREAYYWNHVFIEGATNTDTMAQTMPENVRSHRHVIDYDARALLDDIDMVTYRDRGTRLTRWAEQ